MNIIEATKKATEANKAIYRNYQPDIQFIPTNSGPLAFVVIASDNDKVGKFWNPNAEDILAEDWEIMK
ncbi:MW1434 family type I TA system toxin [Lactococcus muris]|uniref:MW1434 family type I TA system toxin n=1 Tax=Lactococcus muris TaxID=2941330 RepID=A0ABV4D8E4_9LACT